MLICFDSNIWIKELGLNSSVGAAVRFYIKQKNAKVLLPEVVKLEVVTNMIEQLNNFVSKINDNYYQLLTVFGELKELVLPNQYKIESRVKAGLFFFFTPSPPS